ncbi:hypothetical protein FD23_GL001450 [Lactobacillus delbrueckii subsp. delbrueckii DSM 20074 = JCM 1012]|nr:hypothetical protein LDD39_00375 [Lactobacillus delbrueckii subsp. delbrueckii]KRK19371.1 hypothetical protein FD23_GL001450 [Lactobacillus delbrueckii subsp. delbrueckii DSM 20074 = JCM 1012]
MVEVNINLGPRLQDSPSLELKQSLTEEAERLYKLIYGLGNEKKKLYWTYTVDGKMAKVAADKQKLTKNKSKVVFTLKQY